MAARVENRRLVTHGPQHAPDGARKPRASAIARDCARRDIENLRNALDGVEVADAFIPAVAPGSIYWMRNEFYATEEEFLFAFADALHEEYKLITDAGYLVSILASRDGHPLQARFADQTYDFLRDINPPGNRESTGLVTRFGLTLSSLSTYSMKGPRAFGYTFEGVATKS